MKRLFTLAGCIFAALIFGVGLLRAETISIVLPPEASPRIRFGAEKLVAALHNSNTQAVIVQTNHASGSQIKFTPEIPPVSGKEGFSVSSRAGQMTLSYADDSGALYGSLELANRIRAAGKWPVEISFSDRPTMSLRGTCVAMQKTFILPGRKVYEYPYTPELFPWFYDKQLWIEYLDFLVENRMNTLYLWNGHPFASLVRLKDYPYAVEVSDDIFQKNQEQFRWLAAECDKRGIWLVQMFYNIFVSKPFAETNGISTQLAAPTPLVTDYTRKSIAAFVREYPHVGLMVCLGEALQGTENQIAWATNAILPGVLDGMRAANLQEQPPIVIRTHAMNPEAIMPACFTVYSNLFTETKYNGESLTTYEPRGKAAQTHRNMAALGPHLVNVHILANLEPFRYGATEFIRKSILASRDTFHASGLHLYPLAYWNWPYSPDVANPPLKQWERDWIWFEAWARYAWNPDPDAIKDRAYWVNRLADYYGCDPVTAEKILDAMNAAGEIAPQLIRRFGITEGNRQTLSLGMTLDQLVNPKRYNAIAELWESQAPPGERLDEYIRKELAQESHVGETPASVIAATLSCANKATANMALAAPKVKRNQAEFRRWQNDFIALQLLAQNYDQKVSAAINLLRFNQNQDLKEMQQAAERLSAGLAIFRQLATLTQTNYVFANSMQTGHRKIPFPGAASGTGTNYHWSHVVPLYEKELADLQAQVAELKNPIARQPLTIAAWPAAKFKLISTNAETYEVKLGARPFADRKYTITELAPELNGLTGIRFSHEAAKNHRYEPVEFEVAEPVRVLIGYFQSEREIWLQVPNLDFASHADERGGVDALLRNAAAIDECPNLNVHAFRYEPGRYRLELIGKGSFVILGVVPQSAKLEKRDARKGTK